MRGLLYSKNKLLNEKIKNNAKSRFSFIIFSRELSQSLEIIVTKYDEGEASIFTSDCIKMFTSILSVYDGDVHEKEFLFSNPIHWKSILNPTLGKS